MLYVSINPASMQLVSGPSFHEQSLRLYRKHDNTQVSDFSCMVYVIAA